MREYVKSKNASAPKKTQPRPSQGFANSYNRNNRNDRGNNRGGAGGQHGGNNRYNAGRHNAGGQHGGNNRGGAGRQDGATIEQSCEEPYSFVPLPQSIEIAYKAEGDLPPHDVYRADLNTGRIEVEFRCESPLFVGSGESVPQGKPLKFATNLSQKKIVPGSTLRGLIRTNFEVLSSSYPKFVQDRHYAHRGSYTGAGFYQTALKTFTDEARTKKNPRLGAGWIAKNDKGNYEITETSYKHECWDGHSARCHGSNWPEDAPSVCCDTGVIVTEGIGREPRPKHKFTVVKPKGDCKKWIVPANVIKDFLQDLEERQKGQPAIKNNLKFYSLPEEKGKKRPIFFYLNEALTEIVSIGVVRRFRMSYKNSVRELGLNQLLSNISSTGNISDFSGIDYANAVFGFLGNADGGDLREWGFPNAKESYKSRVSFEDAIIRPQGDANNAREFSGVLAGPKGTWVGDYLEQGEHGKMKTYNDDDAQIRGNKMYWSRGRITGNAGNGNQNMGVKFVPVNAGSTFTAVIHFMNLSDTELSLLLNSIKMSSDLVGDENKDKQVHNIGMGKPLGYGVISVSKMNVVVRNVQKEFAQALDLPYEGETTNKALELGCDVGDASSAQALPYKKDASSAQVLLNKNNDASSAHVLLNKNNDASSAQEFSYKVPKFLLQQKESFRIKRYIDLKTKRPSYEYLGKPDRSDGTPKFPKYKKTVLKP
jgi:CRISPR/Cas system CSM-associated protein Csm3 (group 7 of RAMP superfamily)